MPKPRLFFGERMASRLVEAGAGFTDDSVLYQLLAKSDRGAPAGPDGECVFVACYLTVICYAPVTLKVTPYIDGTAGPAQLVTVAGPGASAGPFTEANRRVTTVEVGLSVPYLVAGVERLRTYPRGTWIAVLVESVFTVGASTYVRVDDLVVEHEVVVAPAEPVGVPA
jgi:hypothetical protein